MKTLKQAEKYLLGNPLRDLEEAKKAVRKIESCKSARALARRLSRQYQQDIYLEESATPEEWNSRMVELEFGQ